MRAEAVHGLRPAFRHPFEHGGRLGGRAAGGGVHRKRGLSGALGERHVDQLLEAGDSLVVVRGARDDQALGRHHLAIAAVHAVVLAVGRAHDEAEHATRPGIRFAGRNGETLRAEPAHEMLAFRPGREHLRARGVEDARDLDGPLVHFSATAFRLARPVSNCLPTMPSMSKTTCTTLATYGSGPCMAHVTSVESPLGTRVNTTLLWASNGLTKSRSIATREGAASVISMRPSPTSRLPCHAYTAPLPFTAPL